MRSLFDENAQPSGEKPDADLTLGIGSLLSIFFGVVLICGIFFGFGYSMGRRASHGASAVAAPPAAQGEPAEATNEPAGKGADSDASGNTGSNKNEPGKTGAGSPDTTATASVADPPAGTPSAKKESGTDTPAHANDAERPTKPTRVVEPETATASLTEAPAPHRTAAKPHAGVMNPPAAPVVDAQPTPGHPVMVQIAAVSRQEDAETLAGALRKRGFSPQVRGGTSDKFFHVQVGPFTDKTAAETMKQHLLADGYNAIVK